LKPMFNGENLCLPKADRRPTPNPATSRPTTKRGIAVDAVCRMTPIVKTKQDKSRPHFLPSRSPAGEAARAPKKVPADRMDTIKLR